MPAEEDVYLGNHPIFKALRLAATKVLNAKNLVDACDQDEGSRLKDAMNDFMSSMLELNRIAQEHPDANISIPVEALRNGCDMEAVRISELESILADHDKIRNRNRHMNDLAQLLDAAVGTDDNANDDVL